MQDNVEVSTGKHRVMFDSGGDVTLLVDIWTPSAPRRCVYIALAGQGHVAASP